MTWFLTLCEPSVKQVMFIFNVGKSTVRRMLRDKRNLEPLSLQVVGDIQLKDSAPLYSSDEHHATSLIGKC